VNASLEQLFYMIAHPPEITNRPKSYFFFGTH
jgi:hypothetical protein